MKSSQSGGSAQCRICFSGADETVSHVVATCQGTANVRNRILPEYENLCKLTKHNINFEDIRKNEENLCQFILDPTSLYLPTRLSVQDPLVSEIFKRSRELCFIIDKTRLALLKEQERK